MSLGKTFDILHDLIGGRWEKRSVVPIWRQRKRKAERDKKRDDEIAQEILRLACQRGWGYYNVYRLARRCKKMGSVIKVEDFVEVFKSMPDSVLEEEGCVRVRDGYLAQSIIGSARLQREILRRMEE